MCKLRVTQILHPPPLKSEWHAPGNDMLRKQNKSRWSKEVKSDSCIKTLLQRNTASQYLVYHADNYMHYSQLHRDWRPSTVREIVCRVTCDLCLSTTHHLRDADIHINTIPWHAILTHTFKYTCDPTAAETQQTMETTVNQFFPEEGCCSNMHWYAPAFLCSGPRWSFRYASWSHR